MTFAGQREAIGAVPVPLRIANALQSYAGYVWKTVYPANLSVIYTYPTRIDASGLVFALFVLAGISIAVFAMRNRYPYLGIGWLWFLLTLLPVIGIVQAGPQARADRFSYIPSIGLLAAIVWLAADILPGRWPLLLVLATVAILAFTSVHQIRYWRDSETLFSHAVAVTHGNVVARLNLGEALVSKGDFKRAGEHYEEALRIGHRTPVPLVEMGTMLIRQQRYEEAIDPLERAVRLNPRMAVARENLGVALLHAGRSAEALPHLEEALALGAHRTSELRIAIATAKLESGRVDEAIAELTEIVRTHPPSASLQNELGNAHSRRGDDAKAEAAYREAARIDPRLFDARMNLAALLSRQHRNAEALAAIESAARLHPSSPEPHVFRALILANEGRNHDAAEAAERALRIDAAKSNQIFTNAVRLPPGESNLRDFVLAMRRR